jgi:hypothetical protein
MLAISGCGAPPSTNKPTPDVFAPIGSPEGGGSEAASGCPITLAEAKAAVPGIVSGPDIGQPFKNVTADCGFATTELDAGGRPASVLVLVFDAQGAGTHMWDSARSDPNFPNATAVPGVGDDAFVTGAQHFTDLFAVRGQVALHLSTTLRNGLTVEQFAALAKAAFAGLVS